MGNSSSYSSSGFRPAQRPAQYQTQQPALNNAAPAWGAAQYSSAGFQLGQQPAQQQTTSGFARIADQFSSLQQVQDALRNAGLESSNIIIAIDYTKSNEWNGKRTFSGRSLHDLRAGSLNPYQRAISIIARTLAPFDDDYLIPCYGFGDSATGDSKVFCFKDHGAPCEGLEEVETLYEDITPAVKLAGPTSFAPAIRQAMHIVATTGKYHILLLLADGQVTRSSDLAPGQRSPQEEDTIRAIVEASNFPLSIVMVGVGDGPWEQMEEFDDQLPQRRFDNFQFVNFSRVAERYGMDLTRMEAQFALSALMEIPDQYKAILRLGMLGRPLQMRSHVPPVLPPPRPAFHGAASGRYPAIDANERYSAGSQRFTAPAVNPFAPQPAPQQPAYGATLQPPPNAPSQQYQIPDADRNTWPGMQHQAMPYGNAPPTATPFAATHISGGGGGPAGNAPPKSFVCPITTEIMQDPVMAADGHSYERSAIEEWLRRNDRSPMTNEVLPHKNLIPNHTLRCSIQEYAAQSGLRL